VNLEKTEIEFTDPRNASIPFFFEPNIDAVIKPLGVIGRNEKEGKPMREPVLYGDYLRSKVANNFAIDGQM
jgi:isopenicillin N synthase-like dioxygenase